MMQSVRSVPPPRPDTPHVVLAHDWLCGLRGGERVLDRIARAFPSATLLTMFDDGRPVTPAIDALPRVVPALSKLPLASGALRRWLLPLYPSLVRSLSARLAAMHAQRPVDLLISTSSAAVKNLAVPTGVPHICYMHAPARYIWSHAGEYERDGGLRAIGLRLVRERFKRWDRAGTAGITVMLANSNHTAGLCRGVYGRDAEVLFPPMRTTLFGSVRRAREDFWLVVSALEPYKRVDLAIEASKVRGHRLVVVGDRSQAVRLRRGAGPTVEFAGRVDDAHLADLYASARVLLFPQVEDFGIVAAEALASGLPVVARRAGGALDIVTDGVTGAFFDAPTPEALLRAIDACPREVDEPCRRSAERFAEECFDRALDRVVRGYLPG